MRCGTWTRWSAAIVALGLFGGCGDEASEPAAGPELACAEGRLLELSPARLPLRIHLTEPGVPLFDLRSCELAPAALTPGLRTDDHVLRVVSDVTAVYRFTLRSTEAEVSQEVAQLALTDTCDGFVSGRSEACLASTLSRGDGLLQVEAHLEAGRPYNLIIDGATPPFTVSVGCGCGQGETCTELGGCRPRVAGDGCDQPLMLPADGPREFRGATAGSPDGGSVPASCSPDGQTFGVGSPDRVHAFVAEVAGIYPITLQSLDGARLGLGVFAGCGVDVDDATCVAAAAMGPEDEAVVVSVELGAEDTAWLLVDGVSGGAGAYALSVGEPCVPNCDVCGLDDGCGRSCGCALGEFCQAGACVDDLSIAGNTCRNPHAIDLEGLADGGQPVTVFGDVSVASGLGASQPGLGCPGVEATGAHAPDEVWRVEIPSSGRWSVLVRPLEPGVDVLLHAFEADACDAASCLASADAVAAPSLSPERLDLELEAGDVLHLVVGAWRPSAGGPYALSVGPGCTPSCEGGCGGDDGCGGRCDCPFGQWCEEGLCLLPEGLEGNTCQSAFALTGALPLEVSGDLGPEARVTAAVNASRCGGFVTGGSAPDQVWRFEAPAAGHFEVSATPLAEGVDLLLYAFADEGGLGCGTRCVAFADEALADPGTPEIIRLVAAEAGEAFFIVVDAWAPDRVGPYTLRVEEACAPTCPADGCGGDDGCGGTCGCAGLAACRDARCLPLHGLAAHKCGEAAPISVGIPAEGVLEGADLRPVGCGLAHPDAGLGPERVHRFEAPSAGTWEVRASPLDAPLDLVLHARAAGDCALSAGACVAAADRAPLGLAPEVMTLTSRFAGEAFAIVVDSFPGADGGRYRLEIEAACAPACDGVACGQADGCGGRCGCGADGLCRAGGCVPAADVAGDSCVMPRALEGFGPPFFGAGDLGAYGALGDRHAATGCTDGIDGAGAPDEVWVFTAPDAGTWEVRVEPTAPADRTDLLLYAYADSICVGGCLGFSDAGGPGEAETLLIEADSAGARFSLVVDAWSAGTAGRYALRVGRPCAPSCEAGRCGADGCGGRCACASGQACGAGELCVLAAPGDTCDTALDLTGGALPWMASGDVGPSSGMTHARSASACGVPTPGRDTVWRVVPPAPGAWQVVVTPTDGAALAVHLDEDARCGGGCDRFAAGSGEAVSLTFEADGLTPWWLTVDAMGAGGPFTVHFDAACTSTCAAGCGQDDGCGGVCGCPGGGVCEAGACVDADDVPGNTCASPRALDEEAGRWAGAGDIGPDAQLGDALSAARCGVGPAGRFGVDEVWAFTVPEAGSWVIRAHPGGRGDLLLYAFSGGDCERCLGFSDEDRMGGVGEVLRLDDLDAGEVLRIVVDQVGGGGAGAYTLTVEPACDGDCDGVSCGQDDGCGQLCGCDAPSLCDAASLACGPAEEALGNTCARPRSLAVGGTEAGDLRDSVFLDDRLSAVGCPLGSAFTGAGGTDEVYVLTAERTGLHHITLTPEAGADLLLYAFAGQSCTPGTCLGHVDAAGPGQVERISIWLVAGDSARLVVDTWAPAGAGAYTITAEGP